MENFIHQLSIQNFKTIANIEMPCKKVNVFVGRPNVGKSNILEAMSLLCPETTEKDGYLFKNLIRYKNPTNLFRDDDTNNEIIVNIKDNTLCLIWEKENDISLFLKRGSFIKNRWLFSKDKLKNITSLTPVKPRRYLQSFVDYIKKYQFKTEINYTKEFESSILDYPNGRNLFEVIKKNTKIRKEFSMIFKAYGLKLVYNATEKKFEIQKEIDDVVNSYPYEHTADTLQRLIFYLTAIYTNQNTALIFEEPETHAFPPYIRTLAKTIAEDITNQFFLTTHSPYILEVLLDNLSPKDINVCVVYFEDYETKIRILTNEELNEMTETGTDIFLNLGRFEKPLVENEEK